MRYWDSLSAGKMLCAEIYNSTTAEAETWQWS